MSYLRPGSASRSRSRRPGRGVGDDQVPSVSPVGQLAAQVNRFGAGAPPAYQFATAPFDVASGNLDLPLAITALTIYQRRLTDAYQKVSDAGTLQALTAANAGFSDPVGFVSVRVADITQTIGQFADSLGLPAAVGQGTVIESIPTGIWVAAAVIAYFWWSNR